MFDCCFEIDLVKFILLRFYYYCGIIICVIYELFDVEEICCGFEVVVSVYVFFFVFF